MWTKILVFKLFSELGKISSRLFKNPNLSYLLRVGKNLEVYTVQDQHYKIQILNLWTNWENLCPNLSFAVENKVGNSHKKGWSHFILSINDWDILFPKILRIYELGKICSTGENGIHQLKRQWRYLFLVYVFIALVN